MRYIDMHCDTLSQALMQQKDTIFELENTMVDVRRLLAAGAGAQFFAMFVPQRNEPGWFDAAEPAAQEELLMKLYGVYVNTLEQHKDVIAAARSIADYRKNQREGKLSAFLTMENGAVAQGKLENIQRFYDMGVRLITLTWNDPNCFGTSHSAEPGQMAQGLTEFGKEAVEYMNELGILVDVSHLSDGGFYDVAKISKKPFVASHSNCRSLCAATRNLTDEMICILAEKGGVCGINLEPTFVNRNRMDRHTTVEALCGHIEHMRQTGGEDCIGIGTDFDGISGTFEIADCTYLHLLFDALHRKGYSDDLIDKIAFGNVERVIAATL